MSSLTNFLKLFKWNTSTDGSQKFNIDKALNENWDKVESNAKAVDDILKTKSDKKYKGAFLSTTGWYRIAKINRTNTNAYANSIINLHTMWNQTAAQGITFIATAMGNERKITILSSSTPHQFSKLRIVTETDDEGNGTGYDYVEAYYKVSQSNNVFVQILDDDVGIEAIKFEKAVEENEIEQVSYDITKYDVNSAIGTLSSLKTTDKTSLVNALNELRLQTRSYMSGNNIETTTLLTERTFDEIMGLEFPSVFCINANTTTVNGAGFPTDAYGYGLLITYRAASDYARTQIYITDMPYNRGIYIRTRVGGSWLKIGGNVTTGTEFATSEYIDGKQVYRKRIDVGALPNATTKNVAHGLSNVTFIRMQGIATAGSTTIPLPFSHISSSAQCVQLSITSTNVIIETKTDRTGFNNAYVDLYYTKNN